MKIEFVTNASAVVTLAGDRTILFDPWYTGGAYYGSWYNFPPLQNRERYISLRPSCIYVSHIHPDHLDPATLRNYPADTEIWIGRLAHPHLERILRSLGFGNIRQFPLGELVEHDGLAIAVFGDFAGSSFGEPNDVNYALDTSLYVRDTNGESFFNISDNSIQTADAERFVATYGNPTVSFVPYSGASLYPHAFLNYSEDEKKRLKQTLTERMCQRFLAISRVLGSEWVVPTAGTYVMGGAIASYSRYLHQATPEYLTRLWDESGLAEVSKMALMMEGDVLDTGHGRVVHNGHPFRDFTEDDRSRYAETLSSNRLLHEEVVIPEGFKILWALLLDRARQNLWAAQQRYSAFPNCDIEIHLTGAQAQPFVFPLDRLERSPASEGASAADGERQTLKFHLDHRLMVMILLRAAHWNNVEIGGLVQVERTPDQYVPTIHALMSYFHL